MTKKPDPSSKTIRIDIPRDGSWKLNADGIGAAEKGKRLLRNSARVPEKDKYRSLLQGIYDAILIADEAGNILDANPRALEFFGYGLDELRDLSLINVIAGADAPLIQVMLNNLRQERFTLLEGYGVARDGTTFPAEIAVNRIFLSDEGELCLSVRNLTARHIMEGELRRANATKGLHILAGSVAHDFTNLLTSVIGNTELAISSLPAQSRAKDDLIVALDDAKKMAELSDRMLAYAGKGLLQRGRIDLDTTIHTVVDNLAGTVSSAVDISIETPDTHIHVAGEQDLLESMLSNLITNAVEATAHNGGTVHVSLSREVVDETFLDAYSLTSDLQPDEYACVRIIDTGYGMDTITVGKIFDPTFSTKGTGRGLGMTEVQGILLAHGGAIAVDSEIGRGSTFIVLMPLFVAARAQTSPVKPAPATGSKGMSGIVLVIDDEPSVRRYIHRTLDRQGLTALMAEDGLQGLDMFREHADTIGLVILDMFMPKMNGTETMHAIRKIRPEVKILMTSGYMESVFTDQLTDDIPTAFLHKPFATDTFIATLTEILGA